MFLPSPLREKDATVRLFLAESISALAATKIGRDAIWKVKGAEILQKG